MVKEPTVWEIQSCIFNLPNRPPFMLDYDLAKIYETETKRINEAVRRNPKRFPADFCFRLTNEEVEILRSQKSTAISNMSRTNPNGFSREGSNMLSAILHTDIAIDRSVQIMRAFSALEAFLCQQTDSESPGRITGERFDLSVKRFKIALEAAKLSGIRDEHEARLTANRITKETTGVDLLEFVRPGYVSSVSDRSRTSSPDKADENMVRFVSAWWEAFSEDAVLSRQLYQLITDNKIPMNLGTGSKRSQKIRLSRLLSKMSGQQVGTYHIVDAGKCKNVRVWNLEKIGSQSGPKG